MRSCHPARQPSQMVPRGVLPLRDGPAAQLVRARTVGDAPGSDAGPGRGEAGLRPMWETGAARRPGGSANAEVGERSLPGADRAHDGTRVVRFPECRKGRGAPTFSRVDAASPVDMSNRQQMGGGCERGPLPDPARPRSTACQASLAEESFAELLRSRVFRRLDLVGQERHVRPSGRGWRYTATPSSKVPANLASAAGSRRAPRRSARAAERAFAGST